MSNPVEISRKKTKLKVRKPRFDFTTTGPHYLSNNLWATHFMNAMQVIVPIGEEFFINSVRPFLAALTDNEQLKEVRAFIGQEKVHGKAHQDFWRRMEEHGLDIRPFERFYQETGFDMILPVFQSLFGDKFSLAATVALEHYTASMSTYIMEEDPNVLEELEPGARELILWHFAEEIEHKSVAFDVLKEIDDSYLLRVGAMAAVSPLLFFYIFTGAGMFLAQDKAATPARLLADFLRAAPRFGKMFAFTAGEFLDYFRPDFHPDDRDNYYLIEKFMPAMATG